MDSPALSRSPRRPPAIAALRADIRRLEHGGRSLQALPLGLPALDDRLPGGGLPLACLHEIEGARPEWDDGAATGFCLLLLARLLAARPGPLLWVAGRGDLYAPGLAALGVDPDRVILVQTRGEAELLWAMEEGLRCPRLAAVVGETGGLDRRAGRRLQLAAEGGVTAFALARRFTAARREPSAAVTRWRVSAAPSAPLADGIGRPCWQVELLRCRGAAPGSWRLTAPLAGYWAEELEDDRDAAGGVAVAAALRDGALDGRPAVAARRAG